VIVLVERYYHSPRAEYTQAHLSKENPSLSWVYAEDVVSNGEVQGSLGVLGQVSGKCRKPDVYDSLEIDTQSWINASLAVCPRGLESN
jgi:hypothetical protein